MTIETVPPLEAPLASREPFWIAMIIDGVVYEVMNVKGESAARFLAQPTFVQIEPGQAQTGYTYDGTSFALPAAE
jgi:hypothetical protein